MHKLDLHTQYWCLAELKQEETTRPGRKLALHPTALSRQQLWKHHITHSATLYTERHNERCGHFIWKCKKEISCTIFILSIINATSLLNCVIQTAVYLYELLQLFPIWFSHFVWDFQSLITLSVMIMIFHGNFSWDYPLGIWNFLWDFWFF